MIVAGLDCSGDALVLGVAQDKRIVGSWVIPARRRHSELLPGEFLQRLKLIHLTPVDIGGFAIVSGPGSYTGLRVGAATIMGLAAAVNAPTSALSTFEFLRRLHASKSRWLGCLIPCRGDLYYWRAYPPGVESGSETEILTLKEIIVSLAHPFRIVGPRTEGFEEAVSGTTADVEVITGLPDDAGGRLALWGAEKIAAGEIIDWSTWQLDYGPAPGFRKWKQPNR